MRQYIADHLNAKPPCLIHTCEIIITMYLEAQLDPNTAVTSRVETGAQGGARTQGLVNMDISYST